MSFDIFNYRNEHEELRDMFSQLTDDNYAVSHIPYDVILQYTLNLKYAVKLTRRRNGTVKVKRLSQHVIEQPEATTEALKQAPEEAQE